MALDEPYRTTVLLRYYEGLTAAAIARLLSVPAGTVRWRLSQALDRLRAGVQRDDETGRLVVVLGGWGLSARSLLSHGGLLMAAKKKVAVFVAVLAALAGGGALVWRGTGPAHPPATAARIRAVSARPPIKLAPPPIQIPTGEGAGDADGPGSVEGRVVSALDGSAVPSAELTFAHGESSLSTQTGADGRFTFTPPPIPGATSSRGWSLPDTSPSRPSGATARWPSLWIRASGSAA